MGNLVPVDEMKYICASWFLWGFFPHLNLQAYMWYWGCCWSTDWQYHSFSPKQIPMCNRACNTETRQQQFYISVVLKILWRFWHSWDNDFDIYFLCFDSVLSALIWPSRLTGRKKNPSIYIFLAQLQEELWSIDCSVAYTTHL